MTNPLSEPVVTRNIVQITYDQGWSIVDRFGRIAERLTLQDDGWAVQDIRPNNSITLVHVGTNIKLSIGVSSISFDLEEASSSRSSPGTQGLVEAELKEYRNVVVLNGTELLSSMGVREVRRIGYRRWYSIPFDSIASTERWIEKVGGIQSVSNNLGAFYDGKPHALNFAFVYDLKGARIRLAVGGVNKPADIDVGGGVVLQVKDDKVKKDRNEKARIKARDRKRLISDLTYAAVIDVDYGVEEFDAPMPSLETIVDNAVSTIQSGTVRLLSAVK